MLRRKFIAGLVGTTAFPLEAPAQTPTRTYRLGHLANSADSEAFTRQITLPELARLGFVEGRNLLFDARVGEPNAIPSLMRELLAGQPDAVVAIGPTLAAAGASTRSVPVVAFGSDPIALGLAASYARPGGNVTWVVILTTELEAKRWLSCWRRFLISGALRCSFHGMKAESGKLSHSDRPRPRSV